MKLKCKKLIINFVSENNKQIINIYKNQKLNKYYLINI